MEIMPAQFANESCTTRAVCGCAGDGCVASRGTGRAQTIKSGELVEAFDITGSLTFPTETFIS